MDMEVIINWKGWTAINSICQIFLVLFAFLAICLTISQIGNRKKIKICFSEKKEYYNGKTKINDSTKILSLDFFNYGVHPIFIKQCWIGISKSKNLNRPKIVEVLSEKKFINPGESMSIDYKKIEDCINELFQKRSFYRETNPKVYFFVENGAGKVKRYPLDSNYIYIRAKEMKKNDDIR